MIIRCPGFISEFAGTGNGAEHPFEFAGDDVETLNVTGCPSCGFRQVQGHDDGTLEDRARCGRRDKAILCCGPQPYPEIDAATVTEIGDQLSIVGIQGMQETSGGEEDTSVITLLPVHHAAALIEPLGIARKPETPDLIPCPGPQGEDLLRSRRSI